MSKIEWTDQTWNPVVGCTKVSEGCRNCYAMTMGARLVNMADADLAAGRNPGRKAAYQKVMKRASPPPGVVNARDYNRVGVLKALPVWNNEVVCVEEALAEPLGWKKPRMVFVNSMGDLFHEEVPFAFIDKVFAVMALCPRHTFQVLTKRPEIAAEYLLWADVCSREMPRDRVDAIAAAIDGFESPGFATKGLNVAAIRSCLRLPLPNVWLGTSCENQAKADERIPHLLRCPAHVRFISAEPLLGELSLAEALGTRQQASGPETTGASSLVPGASLPRIDWVIVGGESGAGARACDVGWVRSVVKQCRDAGVPVFVKQLGRWVSGPHDFDGWKGKIDRWLLRDPQSGKASTYTRPVIRSDYAPQCYDERPGNAVAWGLGDAKGGDPWEWPEDLRVREMPGGKAPGTRDQAPVESVGGGA